MAKEKLSPKVPAKERALEPLSNYIHLESIIVDLKADSKAGLLDALSRVVVPGADRRTTQDIRAAIVEREASVDTYVGNGIAIPQARVAGVDGIHLALAKNPDGFPYGRETDEPVRIAVLVVGNDTLQSEHVRVLNAVAATLAEADIRERILAANDTATIRRLLGKSAKERGRRVRPLSQLLLSHARRIGREMGANAILVVLESRQELKVIKRLPRRKAFIVATSSRRVYQEAEKVVDRVLLLPNVPLPRDARVRLTALMALSHRLIERGDVVALIFGAESGLDSLSFLEVGREFGRFVSPAGKLLPGIDPLVLERVLALASELGREGREGKAIGTVFVIGGGDKVDRFCQQMVMNPFRGYPEDERNILDPTLRETIKEFANLDGAFVLRGDGVLLAAGVFLNVPKDAVGLPGGYGTRHRASCAITAAASCLAVTLSQSTGEITVFRKGRVMIRLPQEAGR